ncbi:MAG: hypothetical protein A49_14840 [Methyloceanibacter sp.]|nr:MAG: hypothetical protein A49_14840 [Methyloceanibacter sp.]
MSRNAHGKRIEPGRDKIGDAAIAALRGDQRQRAGPESRRQRAGVVIEDHERFGGGEIRNMHDQGIEPGPLLGRENLRHGGPVPGIGAEPIDGLRRERDDLSPGEGACGLSDGLICGGNNGHGTIHVACPS